ncbi:MAG: OmpA family protein [Rhodospirillales bacterium]|nr:OmpA family protein [Rhodospirillales bacterium]
MMSFGRICVLGAVAVALSACGGLELGKAKSVGPKGSPFDQHLYAEYITLSQMEYDEADYRDSDTFALRAVAAGSGKSPDPEAIAARSLPADKVGELTSARGRLVAVLGAGAADRLPQPAARAQAMFDCWMQEQEENFQPNDIAACRAGFEEAMARLETAPRPAPMAAAPAPQPAPQQPAAQPAPGPFLLYFDFDSASVTMEGQKVVAAAAKAAVAAKSGTVIVTGYTDRAGSDAYNMALSKRRADSVAAALKQAGVTAEMKILVASLGETDPQVPTADGQREARNRRVSIVLR